MVKRVQRVSLGREEDEDSRVSQETVNLARIVENETGEVADTEDGDSGYWRREKDLRSRTRD